MASDSFHGVAAGTLYRQLFEETRLKRAEYERLIDALVASGHIRVEQASFEKEGREIRYRRLWRAAHAPCTLQNVNLPSFMGLTVSDDRVIKRKRSAEITQGSAKNKRSAAKHRKGTASGKNTADKVIDNVSMRADDDMVDKLKTWRLAQAKMRRIPAFQVMPDRTLLAIAEALPKTMEELLQLHGIGTKIAQKYGQTILRLVNRQ